MSSLPISDSPPEPTGPDVGTGVWRGVAGFAVVPTLLASSLLLFVVQPMMGRVLLPVFGGAPGVWTACLLFYQTALLGGYAYVVLLTRSLAPGVQWRVHAAVWLLAAGTLVLGFTGQPRPGTPAADPTWQIVSELVRTIGVPYFALAATSPLLATWSAPGAPATTPFRMYAASNLGSLLGLWGYPLLVESMLPLSWQRIGWAAGCLLLAPWVVWIGRQAARGPAKDTGGRWTTHEAREPGQIASVPPPDSLSKVQWFLLSACGSAMLLATSNLLCLDVAPVPLLWIMPLTIYLVTFAACFLGECFYQRWLAWPALAASAVLVVWTLVAGASVLRNLPLQIGCLLLVQAVVVWICHGELYRSRPRQGSTAGFYLGMAAGGVAGASCVSLLAPRLFVEFYEFYGTLAGAALLLWFCQKAERIETTNFQSRRRFLGMTASIGGGCVLAIAMLWLLAEASQTPGGSRRIVDRGRNFYGTLRVVKQDVDDAVYGRMAMVHGTTVHGFQYLAATRRSLPTGYFAEDSGVGLAMKALRAAAPHATKLRVGIVGLGVGALAAYGEPGDSIVFYEINPLVVRCAETHFTFLQDARRRGVEIRIVEGDARVSLQRERVTGTEPVFDLLVMDAFSGDAVPTHLLTRESMELYRSRLSSKGMLAVQVTNRHLRLTPLVRTLAGSFHAECVRFTRAVPQEEARRSIPGASVWMLISSHQDLLQRIRAERPADAWEVGDDDQVLWTDERNSLVPLLRAVRRP